MFLAVQVFGSESIYFGAEQLLEFQKNPDLLARSREQFLKTLGEQKELLYDEKTVETIGYRIFRKLELIKNFEEKTPIFYAILKEDTIELANLVSLEKENLQKYVALYPIMEFIQKDFEKDTTVFDYTKILPFLAFVNFPEFEKLLTVSNEKSFEIAKGIVEDVQKRNVFYDQAKIKPLTLLLGEKFVRAFGSLLQPLITMQNEDDFLQEYQLVKLYFTDTQPTIADTEAYTITENLFPELVKKSSQLSNYFRCLEDTMILTRRLSTASAETFFSFNPVVIAQIDLYESLLIHKAKLEIQILALLRTYHQRMEDLALKLTDEKTIQSFQRVLESDTGLAESIASLLTSALSEKKETTTGKKTVLSMWLPYIYILATFLVLIALVFILPLPAKASFFRIVGLKEKALSLYEKVALLQPQKADYHVKMAMVLESLHREEEAIREYRIASRILEINDNKKTRV